MFSYDEFYELNEKLRFFNIIVKSNVLINFKDVSKNCEFENDLRNIK